MLGNPLNPFRGYQRSTIDLSFQHCVLYSSPVAGKEFYRPVNYLMVRNLKQSSGQLVAAKPISCIPDEK